MNLFSPFDPAGIAQLVKNHAQNVRTRVAELESKQRRKTADNDEINELAILCDHHDFNLHQELIGIARTRQAEFPDNISFLNHLRTQLYKTHANQNDDPYSDVQVVPVSTHSFMRTATLDSILFDLEHALLPDWPALLHMLRSSGQVPSGDTRTGSRADSAIRAFWADTEQLYPVPQTHIRYILDHPGQFGFQYEQLRQEFRDAGEPIGFEGKARRRIIARALKKGWLHARLHTRGAHHGPYLGLSLHNLSQNSLALRILFCYLSEHGLIHPEEQVQLVDTQAKQQLFSYPSWYGGAARFLSDMAEGHLSVEVL